MDKTEISAVVVGDSLNEFGDRITTFEVVFPRDKLSELNTHRMLTKNSASSRAIPFKRLLKMVKDNPYIPVAWQKDHPGMQGTEYFTDQKVIDRLVKAHLNGRDRAIQTALEVNAAGGDREVTKGIINRYLEPFMWHKVLITGTELENFFHLRCPQYRIQCMGGEVRYYRSRKDTIKSAEFDIDFDTDNILNWLNVNTSFADIHISFLAEAMWDAYNESTPRQLRAGEWHIPYENRMDYWKVNNIVTKNGTIDFFDEPIEEMNRIKVKISTGMCARTSYTVVGDEKEVSYETLIGIHDKMIASNPLHASPFEHCSIAMNKDQRYEGKAVDNKFIGWSGNFKGFTQYRKMIPNENVTNRI